MSSIFLKSNAVWCTHELKPLTPICTHNENEMAFKINTSRAINIIRGDNRELIGIEFSYGPILYIGQRDVQTNLLLKDVCPAFNGEGNYVYTVLIFEK